MISASQWWPACFSEKVLSETLCMLSEWVKKHWGCYMSAENGQAWAAFLFAAEVFTNERIPFNFLEQVSTGDKDGVSLWLCYSRPLTITKRRVLFLKNRFFFTFYWRKLHLHWIYALKFKCNHNQNLAHASCKLFPSGNTCHILQPHPPSLFETISHEEHSSFLNTYCWTASPYKPPKYLFWPPPINLTS